MWFAGLCKMKTWGPYSKIKTFKTERVEHYITREVLLSTKLWAAVQVACPGSWPCFFFFFNNFIYLFLAVLEPRAFRSFVWAYSASGEQVYFLVAVVSLAMEHRLWGARPQQLGHMGLAALWHMGSSWTRDQTHVPCIGRQILIYCTTREVLALFLTIPRESLRLAGLWPHHPERARSCLMLEAKQGRAWLVLGWETG